MEDGGRDMKEEGEGIGTRMAGGEVQREEKAKKDKETKQDEKTKEREEDEYEEENKRKMSKKAKEKENLLVYGKDTQPKT